MRVISIICLLILAATRGFAESPQASIPVTTLISQAPLLAELDHDNTSPLSLLTLFRKIHASQKLPLPVVATGPTRASDLLGFNETYAQFAAVMSADVARIISGMESTGKRKFLGRTTRSRPKRTPERPCA